MPFPQQTAREFNRANIERITPGTVGVYGIFRNQSSWIYVGRGDIRARLLSHLNGDNSCITGQGPTHYMDEVTNNDEARERQLILELQPICNKKVG
jgi:hypothetical protein